MSSPFPHPFKQAFLITAYKDLHRIIEFVNLFAYDDFVFYIHLDRKEKFDSAQIAELKSFNQVKLINSKYKVLTGVALAMAAVHRISMIRISMR